MELEKKYMSKEGWKRVKKREYICKKIEEENITGQASIISIKEVSEPCFKSYTKDINIKIADNNYSWLQLAIEDKNYWITAMYNEKGELIQYYIDITEKNVINSGENSYFFDLFLDIVVLNNGKIFLLDEDELEKALEENKITREQYDFAYEVADNIIKSLKQDKDKLKSFCDKYFKILNKQLNEKKTVKQKNI